MPQRLTVAGEATCKQRPQEAEAPRPLWGPGAFRSATSKSIVMVGGSLRSAESQRGEPWALAAESPAGLAAPAGLPPGSGLDALAIREAKHFVVVQHLESVQDSGSLPSPTALRQSPCSCSRSRWHPRARQRPPRKLQAAMPGTRRRYTSARSPSFRPISCCPKCR